MRKMYLVTFLESWNRQKRSRLFLQSRSMRLSPSTSSYHRSQQFQNRIMGLVCWVHGRRPTQVPSPWVVLHAMMVWVTVHHNFNQQRGAYLRQTPQDGTNWTHQQTCKVTLVRGLGEVDGAGVSASSETGGFARGWHLDCKAGAQASLTRDSCNRIRCGGKCNTLGGARLLLRQASTVALIVAVKCCLVWRLALCPPHRAGVCQFPCPGVRIRDRNNRWWRMSPFPYRKGVGLRLPYPPRAF
mmetsp:Transcript_44945/g.118750  ORF Transcript_44945/g.118750 Transcript_44945/m.118750 type:complete len:242 (-) Transcript_44945:17-742(-)